MIVTVNALARYLRKNKMSADEFALLVGAHRSQIYRAMSGERRPGVDLAVAIDRVTGGDVPVSSWTSSRRSRAA
jgi:transcriptional regulator with XRE-family HTH domain